MVTTKRTSTMMTIKRTSKMTTTKRTSRMTTIKRTSTSAARAALVMEHRRKGSDRRTVKDRGGSFGPFEGRWPSALADQRTRTGSDWNNLGNSKRVKKPNRLSPFDGYQASSATESATGNGHSNSRSLAR